MAQAAFKPGGASEIEFRADGSGSESVARNYFQSMHRVPLLTRQREVELGKTIESGRRELLDAVVDSPVFAEALSELVGELRSGRVSIKEFLHDRRTVEDPEDESAMIDLLHRAQRLVRSGGAARAKLLGLLGKIGLGEAWTDAVADEHAVLVRLAAGSDRQRRRIFKETGMNLRDLRRIRRRIREAQKKTLQAKREMVEANLRLVVFVARRFSTSGLSFSDLIQEGNIGLMRAVDKFDHRRANRFATYAVHWIRQSIARSIADQSRAIRVPLSRFHQAYKIERTFRRLHQRMGHRPSEEEVAEEMNLAVDLVRQVLGLKLGVVSLDAPLGEEGTISLGDCIEDAGSPSPSSGIVKRELAERTREALATLTPREERILRMRFGIGLESEHTLREIGDDISLTRERVRQIEARALTKLRHKKRAHYLKAFADGDR